MAVGSGIGIQIVGTDKGVRMMLDRLDTRLNPVAVAGFLGAEVAPYLKHRAKTRFAQEGDDVTGGWAPLKEATQTIRASQGYGAAHPINKRTGELERYITGDANEKIHPWGASLTLPGSAPAGDLVDKLRTAQAGDTRAVPRPVLGMNWQDMGAVLFLLADYVEGKSGTFSP